MPRVRGGISIIICHLPFDKPLQPSAKPPLEVNIASVKYDAAMHSPASTAAAGASWINLSGG